MKTKRRQTINGTFITFLRVCKLLIGWKEGRVTFVLSREEGEMVGGVIQRNWSFRKSFFIHLFSLFQCLHFLVLFDMIFYQLY